MFDQCTGRPKDKSIAERMWGKIWTIKSFSRLATQTLASDRYNQSKPLFKILIDFVYVFTDLR